MKELDLFRDDDNGTLILSHPIMREDVCMSVWKKLFTGKLNLTYSELIFSAEKHAGNLNNFKAAQQAGISTSNTNATETSAKY